MKIKAAQQEVECLWKMSSKRMTPLVELACLFEECGELAEAIRKIEHGKEKITEVEKEFGDILLSLITIANRHNVDLQKSFNQSLQSVRRRYVK